MSAAKYLQEAAALLKRIDPAPLQPAAERLADTIVTGGSIFSFGASHSFMVTEELVYRAGGLMLINPIYPHGMNFSVRPLTMTSQLERLPGLGAELLAGSPARPGDTLIIASNSGRNTVTIDMALRARQRGITTIAITALSYVGQVASRHPSGQGLADLCDIVLDNHVPYGDAAVQVGDFPQKVAPLSTIAGCAIANALVAETVALLVARGFPPPVFMSGNLDGGDQYNARLLEQHRQRIHYL